MRLFRRKAVTVSTAKRYFGLGAERARRLGHSHIGSEHVLLGLATNTAGDAAGVLERLGVTPKLVEYRDPHPSVSVTTDGDRP